MPMLAFFPWLRIDHTMLVGDYELVPFIHGEAPGGADQAAADAVLRPYAAHSSDTPVEQATLLKVRTEPLTADLSDERFEDVFEIVELIAFAGLAGRRYFRPFEYCNRDTFTFVIQSFQNPAGMVGLRVRRRDGSTGIMADPNLYRVHQPYHVPTHDRARFEPAFLNALLAIHRQAEWAELEDAMFFFNQANTDRDLTPEQWETVAMLSAFERAIGVVANEGRLAQGFLDLWPEPGGSCSYCRKVPTDQQGKRSLREVWLRDLYRHRGASAHGRRESGHAAIWTRRQHLLLGAFAFPLVVKLLLAEESRYTLTPEDEIDIEIFEQLTCADHFRSREDGDTTPHPWSLIRDDAQAHRALRRGLERAWKEHGLDEPEKPDPQA